MKERLERLDRMEESLERLDRDMRDMKKMPGIEDWRRPGDDALKEYVLKESASDFDDRKLKKITNEGCDGQNTDALPCFYHIPP